MTTKSNVSHLSPAGKARLIGMLNRECDHVSADNDSLFIVIKKIGSLGLKSYGVCEVCSNLSTDRRENKNHTRTDYRGLSKMKELYDMSRYDPLAIQTISTIHSRVVSLTYMGQPCYLTTLISDLSYFNQMLFEELGWTIRSEDTLMHRIANNYINYPDVENAIYRTKNER